MDVIIERINLLEDWRKMEETKDWMENKWNRKSRDLLEDVHNLQDVFKIKRINSPFFFIHPRKKLSTAKQ
jgi:hypothetical protein